MRAITEVWPIHHTDALRVRICQLNLPGHPDTVYEIQEYLAPVRVDIRDEDGCVLRTVGSVATALSECIAGRVGQ